MYDSMRKATNLELRGIAEAEMERAIDDGDKYDVEIIDCETDLVYEYATERWYFHQQEHEEPYASRDSVSFDTDDEARAAWPGELVWHPWD